MIDYLKKFSNKGKTTFIVGGSGLIGSHIVQAICQSGSRVVNIDIKNLGFKEYSGNYNYINFNVSKFSDYKKFFLRITKKFGVPDIFINCSYPKTKYWQNNSFKKINFESYKKNIEIHLNSYVWLAKYVADIMVQNGTSGSIIQLGSIYGNFAQDENIYSNTKMDFNMTYSIIKGGIHNFTRQMSAYYGKYNIRVNTLCPGGVEDIKQDKIFVKNYKKKVPLKRLCKSSEVASVALFLSSEASSYITGSTILVDGGFTVI